MGYRHRRKSLPREKNGWNPAAEDRPICRKGVGVLVFACRKNNEETSDDKTNGEKAKKDNIVIHK